jgi:hypothetical protein
MLWRTGTTNFSSHKRLESWPNTFHLSVIPHNANLFAQTDVDVFNPPARQIGQSHGEARQGLGKSIVSTKLQYPNDQATSIRSCHSTIRISDPRNSHLTFSAKANRPPSALSVGWTTVGNSNSAQNSPRRFINTAFSRNFVIDRRSFHSRQLFLSDEAHLLRGMMKLVSRFRH